MVAGCETGFLAAGLMASAAPRELRADLANERLDVAEAMCHHVAQDVQIDDRVAMHQHIPEAHRCSHLGGEVRGQPAGRGQKGE